MTDFAPAVAGQPPAIQLCSLTKNYGSTRVVDSVSIEVRRGSTLGLIGPNGAGKSTTLRMAIGMLRADSGEARLLGVNMAAMGVSIRSRVGYVPEVHRIYPWMKTSDVLRFCQPMYQNWDIEKAGSLLQTFALPGATRVRNLSKGMQVKLALLIAVAAVPDIFILDEPLSGLDPLARDEFLDCIAAEISDGDRATVLSSHQLEEVERLATEVAIINRGRVLCHASRADLAAKVRRYRIRTTEGVSFDASVGRMVFQQVDAGDTLLTVWGDPAEVAASLGNRQEVELLSISELTLDELYRDFIRGDV